MQFGPTVNVRASGSGLVTETASRAALDSAQTATAPAQVAEQELEADEMGGLPVPKRGTSRSTQSTKFRRALNARVPADLPAVLAFYRRELGKRDWREETQRAAINPDQAVVAFIAPDGPAVLHLSRTDGATTVKLSLRNPAEARKAGIMPKPGQAKVLFGSMADGEAVVTINKQTIRIGAGVGAKKPDGPMLDLRPGKYKFTLKIAGRPGETDEIEVGADEGWGLIIGPGGALALHMY